MINDFSFSQMTFLEVINSFEVGTVKRQLFVSFPLFPIIIIINNNNNKCQQEKSEEGRNCFLLNVLSHNDVIGCLYGWLWSQLFFM
jgi:hypothetical protein